MGSVENEERVMSVKEASSYLGCHEGTAYKYIKNGLLSERRYVRYPRRVFVTEASVLELEVARRAKRSMRAGDLVGIMVRLQRLERRLDALEFGHAGTSNSTSRSSRSS